MQTCGMPDQAIHLHLQSGAVPAAKRAAGSAQHAALALRHLESERLPAVLTVLALEAAAQPRIQAGWTVASRGRAQAAPLGAPVRLWRASISSAAACSARGVQRAACCTGSCTSATRHLAREVYYVLADCWTPAIPCAGVVGVNGSRAAGLPQAPARLPPPPPLPPGS